MINTQEKLKKILDRHTEYRADFKQQLSKAEEKLRDSIQIKEFGQNDIIKGIRKQYAKYIHEINEVLLHKEELPEVKRTRLLDKRRMYMDFIQIFSSAAVTIESIDQWINSEFDGDDL